MRLVDVDRIFQTYIAEAEGKAKVSHERGKFIMYGYWKAIAIHLRKLRRRIVREIAVPQERDDVMPKIAFKAIEITPWYALYTLGMKNAKRVRLRIGRWVEDTEYGFTAARGLTGARQVTQIANGRKRKARPLRTGIAIVQGERDRRE